MAKNYHFILIPAEDDSVDAEYDMKSPTYQNTNFSIQDCRTYGGSWGVNENHYENGQLTAVTDHGSFKTLTAAKSKAITLYEKQSKV
jgi:hypothetical protein